MGKRVSELWRGYVEYLDIIFGVPSRFSMFGIGMFLGFLTIIAALLLIVFGVMWISRIENE